MYVSVNKKEKNELNNLFLSLKSLKKLNPFQKILIYLKFSVAKLSGK